MMRILIAPDSFKDALSSLDVATCLSAGLQKVLEDADCELIPFADGGEGTVDAILASVVGRKINVTAHDPLMRAIEAFIGITEDNRTALIEMAAASGLSLLKEHERNPWVTSTYGTGELIKAALDLGCSTIVIGIGGSATNDGGVGMATALGARFTDADGQSVSGDGGQIGRICNIDLTGLDSRIYTTKIKVACDVTNPLTGPKGASAVYGPQKGADMAMVKQLDANLKNLAELIKIQLNKDIEFVPGAGAAGGLGAGLMAFLNATLVNGFDTIAEITGLEARIRKADLVITGEGRADYQTQFGKTAFGVAQLAKKHQKPVILVAGSIGEGAEVLYNHGVNAMLSILDKPMSLEEALQQTPRLLENTGECIGRLLITGSSLGIKI